MSIFLKDLQVYRKCPEIRSNVRQIYMAKLGSLFTLVIMSPLLLLGLVSIAIVHVFDFVGQIALWPLHKTTDWLQEFQRNTIRDGHSKLPLEEIARRTGQDVD